MPLSVAVVSESLFEGDPRPSFLEGALTGRGDTVHAWRVPREGSAVEQWMKLADAMRGVAKLRASGELHALCVSGGSRTMGLLGMLARPAGLEVVIDLALQGREGKPVDVAIALGASRLMARDQDTYQALLAAGVPAYQAGIALDPPTAGPITPRAKEPQTKGKVPVRITAADAGSVDAALTAARDVKALEPRAVVEVFVPETSTAFAAGRAQALGVEITAQAIASELGALPEALLAWVIETTPRSRRTLQAAGEAMGTGVALLMTSPDPVLEGAEAVTAEAAASRLVALAKDKDGRAALVGRGRAWDETYGYQAQSRLWLRAVDAACAEIVIAQKRAKQAAVEGVKTGKRPNS